MPPVVKITVRNGTNTFTSTEFDRDFKYSAADGPLLVLGSVEPAKKSKPFKGGFWLCRLKVTDMSTTPLIIWLNSHLMPDKGAIQSP